MNSMTTALTVVGSYTGQPLCDIGIGNDELGGAERCTYISSDGR